MHTWWHFKGSMLADAFPAKIQIQIFSDFLNLCHFGLLVFDF